MKLKKQSKLSAALLAVAMVLAMVLTMFPAMAFAEDGGSQCSITENCILEEGHEGDCVIETTEPFKIYSSAVTDYGIQINHGSTNTWVSSNNADDVLGDGTVSYDADTNTLTLEGANLTYEPTGNSVIYVPENKGLKLNLIGTNKITAAQCVYVTGELTITGEGTLEAKGTTYALYASDNLTIDGANVTATTTGTSSAGVQAQGSVNIQNNAIVEGTSSGAWGIYGNNGISIANSNVTASSTSGRSFSGMMSSSGDITIQNSEVVANSANDAGIMTNGDIIITDSDVEATTEFPGSGDDFGIYAIGGENVRISGGTVTATATGKYSNAICAYSAIEVSDNAVITARATSDSSYPALYGETGISVSASRITAESGGDAGIFSPATVTLEKGSDVKAAGHWPAIRGNVNVSISDSKVDATSSNDIAIFSPNNISITDSVVDAKGKTGANGIKANATSSVSGSWISTSGDETFNSLTDSVLINGTEGRVTGNAVVPGNVTIPEGTTVSIPSGTSLTIPEGVTLTNNGTVDVKGSIVNSGTVSCKNHIGGTATCTAKAICSICDEEYGELDASNHDGDTEVRNKSDATCTVDGYTGDTCCTGCNAKLAEGTVIPATGHSFHWVTDKEATSADKGSKHEECSVCGYKKAAVEIPATGTGTTTPTQTSSPKTGDNSNPAVWIILLVVSAGGLSALLLSFKKRSYNGKQMK